MKIREKEILEEYRFHFHLGGCTTSSDRYFLAHDAKEAMRMFDYACSKRHIVPNVDRIEKWNRWSEKWEEITFLTKDPCLN